MQTLTAEDIRSKDDYERHRNDIRRRIMTLKNRRRVPVGDHCSVHFECRDTMHYQVQEMLRAEDSWTRPGAIEDELAAYNPIIPGPGELSATMMLEYETRAEREEHLPKFTGIDRHLWLVVGDHEPLPAEFDRGQIDERGVSSVQYVKWHLDPARREQLKQQGTVVRIVIDHPHYQAQAVLAEQTRQEIAKDPNGS